MDGPDFQIAVPQIHTDVTDTAERHPTAEPETKKQTVRFKIVDEFPLKISQEFRRHLLYRAGIFVTFPSRVILKNEVFAAAVFE